MNFLKRNAKYMILLLIIIANCIMNLQKETSEEMASRLTNRAVELISALKYDSALICLDKAIKFDSTYYYSYGVKASLHTSLKQYDKALKAMEKQIQLKPDLAEEYTIAGKLSDVLLDSIKAKKYYSKALELYDTKIAKNAKPQMKVSYELDRVSLLILLSKDSEAKQQMAKVEKEIHLNHTSLERINQMTRKKILDAEYKQ